MKISTVIRWLLALGCLALCIAQVMGAFKTPGLAAAGHFILGFGALLACVLLIAPETIMPACEFISRIFTTVILPDDRHRKPTLSYVLARRYRQQLRHAEAIEQYRRLIHHYPDEEAAYLELITLAHSIDHAALAAKYRRAYVRRFKRDLPLPEKLATESRSLTS